MTERGPSLRTRLDAIAGEMVERGITLEQAVREFESLLVDQAVRKHDGSKADAARALGIHRNTLAAKARQHRERASRARRRK